MRKKRELKLKGRGGHGCVGRCCARGFARGDIILALANSEVLSVKDFEAVLGKVDKSKTLSVLFRRGMGPVRLDPSCSLKLGYPSHCKVAGLVVT